MKSKHSRIICLILAMTLFLLSYDTAFAASYELGVKKISQNNSNWCWAATSSMVGNYYGRSLSQRDICVYVKGSAVNQTASFTETVTALSYATNKSVTQTTTLSFNSLKSIISSLKPFLLRIAWNGGTGSGHLYVVSGFKDSQNQLQLIDPIAGVPKRYYKYNDLISGIKLDSGTGHYSHTWYN